MKDTRGLKRTLFTAGVFALLAMIYVPAPAQPHSYSSAHYRLIFSQHETGIAFFQLLVNVAFAATVGALAANIPKRVFVWFQRCFLSRRAAIVYFIATLIAGLVLAKLADQAERARQQAIQEAEQARQEAKRARRVVPIDLSGLPDKVPTGDVFDQLDKENVKRASTPGLFDDLIPGRAEIDKENVKRASANQTLAEKALRESKPDLAQDYYRAAALCWRSAYRYDLEKECTGKANQIGWATKAPHR